MQAIFVPRFGRVKRGAETPPHGPARLLRDSKFHYVHNPQSLFTPLPESQERHIGHTTIPRTSRNGSIPGSVESVIYVVSGKARMRWGEKLEFVAEAGPGDFIYVPPYVPHQEINASESNRYRACFAAVGKSRWW